MNADVVCPYCSFKNRVRIDPTLIGGMMVKFCDSDAGGCDRRFVLDWSVTVQVKALKIESEELS